VTDIVAFAPEFAAGCEQVLASVPEGFGRVKALGGATT
jgi:hypothetical protein